MAKSNCGNVQKVFVPNKDEVKTTPVSTGLAISDVAAEKILHFIEKDGKDPENFALKISVVKDGCSGKSYTMDLAPIADAEANQDKIFVHQGAKVIVEKTSYIFVIGSVLEYVETLLMSGFQLSNPNIKKTCSCGSSFAI